VVALAQRVFGGWDDPAVAEMLPKGPGQPTLHLDFARVDFVTASGLGDLVALHKRWHAGGGLLTLWNVRSEVFHIFRVTGLTQVLHIVRGRSTA
jgi:anti-anti-sigma factor